MSNATLSLLLLSALVSQAQEPSSVSQNLPQRVSKSVAAESANQTDEIAQANNGTVSTVPPDSKPVVPPKKKPSTDTNSVEVKRPPIDASMVGYIDNAIVGSEVRIRFDAAFNDAFPDRAEFIYGKCGCYRAAPSPFNDPNAPGPGPGIPNNVNFQTLSFMGEYAPNARFSGFIEIPIRWLQPQGVAAPPGLTEAFPSSGGIGDVQAGVKFALLPSPKTYLTLQLKSYFPSGDSRSGLGTNHYSLEPALLYYGRLSERFELEGELGGWLPIGGSAGVPVTNASGATVPNSSGFAGNILFYGIGPSYRVINHEQFRLSPVIELVGWNVTGGQETGAPLDASGTNIVNIKIGARMSFRARDSIYVGWGKALTSADWYNDIVRVEYRHAF